MSNVQENLKKFKTVVLIAALGILATVYFIMQIVPITQNIIKHTKDYTEAQNTLADKQKLLDTLKEKNKKESEESSKVPKEFFKPIEQGLDAEALISDEFSEILELLRGNLIKTKSVKYEYNPQDDNFVQNVAADYTVARMNLELIATYKKFESFLKELYKHEHFLDIASMEIIPYKKDKKILLINFQLKLYAKN